MTPPLAVVLPLLLAPLGEPRDDGQTGPLESARALLADARYAEAEAAAREALAVAKDGPGPGSLAAAEALDALAEALRRNRGSSREAWDVAVGAVELKEELLGRDHAGVATSLHNLGALLYGVYGDLERARAPLARALEIRERALGPSPEVAMSLIYLANLDFDRTGDLGGALATIERAREIQDAVLSPDHLDVGWREARLGAMLHTAGELEAAERAYRRALAIDRAHLRPGHPRIAAWTSNLALVLVARGDFAAALPAYEEALAARREAYGRDHRTVAKTLSGYASLLAWMGDTGRALPLAEEALAIYGHRLGPDDARTLEARVRLVRLLLARGQGDDGERALELLAGLTDSAIESDAPDEVAHGLLLLGHTLTRLERDGEALACYERALDALEGRDLAIRADLLHARSRLRTGDGREADLARALEIHTETYGPDSVQVAGVRADQAVRALERGEDARAVELALSAERIGREQAQRTAHAFDERAALLHAAVRTTALDVLLAAAAQSPALAEPVWDAVVRGRALVLDELIERRRWARTSGDAEVERLVGELVGARRRLAALSVSGPGADPAEHRRRTLAAQTRKEEAERALADRSAAWRARHRGRSAGLAPVAQALPARAALVAYVRERDSGSGTGSYVAFVLRAGTDMRPVAVPLPGNLDELVGRWRAEVASPGSTAACIAAGRRLRRAVWDPVREHVSGAERVFLVPDGALQLVSFTALPEEAGELDEPGHEARWLIESGPELHLLACERDLVACAETGPMGPMGPMGKGFLALGGVDYGHSSGRLEGPALALARRSDCRHFEDLSFAPLSETAAEIEDVAEHYRAGGRGDRALVLLTGRSAREGAFAALAPGRGVLHLATHGFFLGQDCPSLLTATRGVGLSAPALPGERPPLGSGESPLLRCGLALAGANRRGEHPGPDDGILTAEEVAALDLSGVRWAVLSACGTGLGDVQDGEGVLGLCRAFQQAGARTVIASLWAVDDRATREWMSALYRARFAEGKDTAAAVAAAGLEVLRRRRERGESAHPFFWAGFVAVGDWR